MDASELAARSHESNFDWLEFEKPYTLHGRTGVQKDAARLPFDVQARRQYVQGFDGC